MAARGVFEGTGIFFSQPLALFEETTVGFLQDGDLPFATTGPGGSHCDYFVLGMFSLEFFETEDRFDFGVLLFEIWEE